MRALLHEDPLFLLFAVAALGFVIGRWRVLGVSAGVLAFYGVQNISANLLDSGPDRRNSLLWRVAPSLDRARSPGLM